jgi:hypothetical protein
MASAEARFCDESDAFFGWTFDEAIGRTSHALVEDGGVWLVDPVDARGVEERVHTLGDPRGVIQLLDRHERDGAAFAQRLGVPLHVLPERIEGAAFEFVPLLRRRWWRESALWWPERGTLVVADALGTIGYFRASNEPLGVHPLLRLFPPRVLARYDPSHILCGHGEGIHRDAASALHEGLRTSRRRLLPALAGAARRARKR